MKSTSWQNEIYMILSQILANHIYFKSQSDFMLQTALLQDWCRLERKKMATGTKERFASLNSEN